MNRGQNIFNEKNGYLSSIVTFKYYTELDKNYKWTHRDIEYNNAGIPILKLYIGETKKVFKDTYINGVKTNLPFTTKAKIDSSKETGEKICEITGESHENWITITGTGVGTYKIDKTISGTLDPNMYTSINDSELLVIVEEEPKLIGLKWGHDNPLIVKSIANDIKISLILMYDNEQEFEIDTPTLERLKIVSSNIHAASIHKMLDATLTEFLYYAIGLNNADERCQIKITDESFNEVFNNTIKNIEPLTIVISKNEDWQLLLNSKFKVEYDEKLPLIDIDSLYNVSIFGVYELENGKILKYNIDDVYTFYSQNESIIHTNIKNNTIYPKALGTTQVSAKIHDIYEEFSDIPKVITWDVTIIKSLSKIEWELNEKDKEDEEDKTELTLYIGKNEGILTVIAYYTDESTEDITNDCSFCYNSSIVKVEGNKVIPLVPGVTELYVTQFSENLVDDINKKYIITVIQPIEKIDIIDDEKRVLNETELNLFVKDTMNLSSIIHPENATSRDFIWISTNENIISVNENGLIEAKNEGTATIYMGIKPDEYEPTDDAEKPNNVVDEPNEQLSIYAAVNVSAQIIDVTNIECVESEMILHIGDSETNLNIKILPENATNKQVKLVFESDYRYSPVGLNDDDLTILGVREGTGVLKVISVSNPEVIAEIKVKVIDNRVKKIRINDGNDRDYEYYDDFVESPEVEVYNEIKDELEYEIDDNIVKVPIDKIKNNERWDDDDFPRYYCPINNSLQLSASIEPTNADYADLIWYSSDGTLIKCTENGIITPIARDLDMEGADSMNDNGRRFPNTTWITAFNKKSMKSAICQVRVTRNNITGFVIDSYPKNNYDIDIFNENIKKDLPKPLEYDQDYILWRGENKTLPITILVQDPNFGPSNGFEWMGSVTTRENEEFKPDDKELLWTDIISLTGDSINRDNKKNDFDWTGVNPNQFNINNKNLNMEITAIGLGSVSFYARCTDRYWQPEVITKECEVENGQTNTEGLITLLDECEVSLRYNIIYNWLINNEGIISDAPINNANVKIMKTPDSKYVINVVLPSIYYNENGEQREIFIDDGQYYKYRYRAYVDITKNNQPIEDAIVYITYKLRDGGTRNVKCVTDAFGHVHIPSGHNTNVNINEINQTFSNISYSVNSGEWVTVENSRKVNVTVVDSPKKIYVCFQDNSILLTKGLPDKDLSSVWPENIRVKIKKYKTKYSVPLFIKFDDEFIESLQEFSGTKNECPLNDKYMSFTWFTSNPDVFIPIEPTQVPVLNDVVDIKEEISYNKTLAKWKPIYNLKGYGRYMHILPTGTGKAKLTIMNMMSGQTWERLIEVV